MKQSFLILLLLSAVIPAIAAPNAADTISGKTLGEVVVEARTATPVADGIAYLPSQREKKTSSDYISLLDKMMIPIINVDMATRSVKTTHNQPIAYFINGHEASSMEVNGLLPKDVLKVTVLRMPSDPKYLGKSAVIDFTVKEYIWGGYTAADAYQSFILNQGNYRLYSKFNTGRHHLQASAGIDYTDLSGDHSAAHSEMDMLDADNNPWQLITDSYNRSDRTIRRNYFAGLKWSYLKRGLAIYVSGGVTSWATPEDRTSGQVKYNVDNYADYSTTSRKSDSQTNPYIRFSTQIKLSKKLELNAALSTTFSLNENRSAYTADNLPAPIVNNSSETVVRPYAWLRLAYSLPRNHSLALSLSNSASIYRTHYTGDIDSHQRLTTNEFSAHLTYNFPIAKNWRGKLAVGLPVNYTASNRTKKFTDILVEGNISLNGSIGNDHSIYLNAFLGRMGRISTAYNDVAYLTSQYEAKSGNPSLGLTPVAQASFSYTWMPLNTFSLNLSANWDHRWNDYVIGYTPHNNVMYNYFVNSGQFDQLEFSLGAPFRLFSRKVGIRPSVLAIRIFHSGIYPVDRWGWAPKLYISYIPTDYLAFAVDAITLRHYPSYYKGVGGTSKFPNFSFRFTAAFEKNNFSCNLDIYPFYKYGERQTNLHGPNIISHDTSWSVTGGRRIALSLRYFIDYGRRVEHGNENIVNVSGATSVR